MKYIIITDKGTIETSDLNEMIDESRALHDKKANHTILFKYDGKVIDSVKYIY